MNNNWKESKFAGHNREWDFAVDNEPKGRILYVIGCSWWANQNVARFLEKEYGEYLIINKSIDGLSNTNMINILQNDVKFLSSIKNPFIPVKFLVNFTEIGRNKKEFTLVNPKDFTTSIDFLQAVLKVQYDEVKELVKNYESYITTSFIPNTFNNNKRLIDFCVPTKPEQGPLGYSYSVGTYEFFNDNPKIFKFDKFYEQKVLENSRQYLFNHKHINTTLHPKSVEPYSRFLEYIRV